jgi:2-polyprenyl-3-methyl-5-hydroxy-6-metoxy-1,4-benzoquinol methylase
MPERMLPTMEWNESNVKKFWDFYSNYPELYFTYQYGARIVDVVMPFIVPDSRILDFGCGTGFLINNLIEKPVKIYGVDLSPASVGTVNEKFKNKKNFQGAWLSDTMIANKEYIQFFDVVFLIEVVEHLNDEELKNVVNIVKKLLKPNGKLMITTPNKEDLAASLVYCPESDKVFHRWQHVRSWSMETLESYLTPFGFAAEKIFTIDFAASKPGKTFRYNIRRFINYILPPKGGTPQNPHLVYIGNSL